MGSPTTRQTAFAALSLASLLILKGLVSRRRRRRLLNKLPRLRTHWIQGNFQKSQMTIDADGLRWWKSTIVNNAQFQREPSLVWIFGLPEIHLTRPEDFSRVYATDWPKAEAYDLLLPWLGKGLLTNWGPEWLRKRKMLTPAFHFDSIKKFYPSFVKNTQRLIEVWEERLGSERECVVDAQLDFGLLSMDNIGHTAFGVNFDAVSGAESDFLTATIGMAGALLRRFVNPVLMFPPVWFFSGARREFYRFLTILDKYGHSAVESRKSALQTGVVEQEKKFFLDILLTAKDEQGHGLSKSEVRDEVNTFMFEGHDTVSAGLMWTMYHLASNPDVQDKVVAELKAVLGDRLVPTLEEIPRLDYLNMVIKESHRMSPPVPSTARRVTSEITLSNGFTPPIGTQVALNLIYLHYNPLVWPNPHTFDPTRHVQSESDSRHSYAMLPFAAGNRNCIGQRYALLEEKVVVAMLVRRFVFEAIAEAQPFIELTLRNKGPLSLRVRPRA